MTIPLWTKVHAITEAALSCGALQPIATECEIITEHGCQFLLRTLIPSASAGTQKPRQHRSSLQRSSHTRSPDNPFKPYDPALYVSDLGAAHVCLLNKFNVVAHHLLIVSREFIPQTRRLELIDFTALALCLQQVDGLAFYNSGRGAGASQTHRHLQLIPLPMAPFTRLPLSPLLDQCWHATLSCTPALPFHHAGIALTASTFINPNQAGEQLLDTYHALLATQDMVSKDCQITTPYNLLITRDWMLLVPRHRECFADISFNALAFCGALLVRSAAQASRLKSVGIGHALRAVS